MSTNLPQSKWLEKVARRIPTYAETGVAGWLRNRLCETCKGEGYFRISRPTSRNLRGTDSTCPDCCGSGKRGEWPSLCIVERFNRHNSYISWQEDRFTPDSMPHKVWHILEDTDAFALLEEAGWFIRREWFVFQDKAHVRYWTTRDPFEPRGDTPYYMADSPGELLNAIMTKEVKHGAAD